MEHLNKETFKDKILDLDSTDLKFKGEFPAIIDFYADWCMPCKATTPILEKLEKKYNDKMNIYKIDVDKEKELAGSFGIRSIPTFMFFPTGDKKPMLVTGALPIESFEEIINEHLLEK